MQPYPIDNHPATMSACCFVFTCSQAYSLPRWPGVPRWQVASISPGPSFTFKSKVVGIDLGGATAAQPGPGKPGPASSQLSPRLRTDLCCPVVSVVSVVPSCPSNSGLRLLQDEKSSSVGHLYTLGNRGRAAKWLPFWNHKRL